MSMLEFFYDGRKIISSLLLSWLFLTVFFMFGREIVPSQVYIMFLTKYYGELNPISFLIFYYFIVSYIFASLIIVLYDLTMIISKNRMKNVQKVVENAQ